MKQIEKYEQYEFESSEYSEYKSKIWNESNKLIKKIIKEHSVIQVGDDVEIVDFQKNKILRVVTIKLMAVSSWGEAGEKLSFYYEGVPVAKNGKPIKNRKPIWFGTFIKNDKKYHCPSYRRVEITSAKIYKNN